MGLGSLACLDWGGPASWAVDKSRVSKSVEVRNVWEVYDERLQFMSRQDALLLDESLDTDDVSLAWLVWTEAAEAALADAYQFSGGPLPVRGLVLGRGVLRFGSSDLVVIRFARLGLMLRMLLMLLMFSCIVTPFFAPLLDMRRWSYDSLWYFSFAVGGSCC